MSSIFTTAPATASGGVTSINFDTATDQFLSVGTSGSDFAITDAGGGSHIFNLPDASATARGVIITGAQTIAGQKTFTSAFILSSLTANTVPYLDGSKIITSSAVTPTELGYVSGVTSAIQTQINNKQPLDSTLTALAAYNTNGLLTQTAADTFTGRTITGTAGQITVSNGDGVSGNPTLSLNTAVALKRTRVSVSSNVTLTDNAIHFVDTSAARSLALPNPANATGRITIIDVSGLANTNNITITQFSGEKIELLAASKVFRTDYGSWTLDTNLTDWFME